MDALFVTVDGGGNLPPALGIAREIVRRGGTARFLGHEPQRSLIKQAGFGFTPVRDGRPYDAAARAARRMWSGAGTAGTWDRSGGPTDRPAGLRTCPLGSWLRPARRTRPYSWRAPDRRTGTGRPGRSAVRAGRRRCRGWSRPR